MDDEHTEFDAWAASPYIRDLTPMETFGALCFLVLVGCLAVLGPVLWLVTHIARDLRG